MTDVIAMSQSCLVCGFTVRNDMPEIKHPLEFLQALRERGWDVEHMSPTGGKKPARCPRCVSSS